MVLSLRRVGQAIAGIHCDVRGKSELPRARCWITSRRGDPTAQCNREEIAKRWRLAANVSEGETVV